MGAMGGLPDSGEQCVHHGRSSAYFASVTANVVGGSVTSYTVNNGGSGYSGANNQVYLFGYGYSKNPCQVMPTATVTVVSGAVTAVAR